MPATRLRTVAACLFGLALLWALIAAAGSFKQGISWPDASPLWWLALACALFLSHAFRGARIQCALSQHAPVGLWDGLRLGLVHSTAVNLLPLRGGELMYPWLAHRRFGIGRVEALASLVWMRVQDTAVLGGLALLLLPPWSWAARLAVLLLAGLAVWCAIRSARRSPPRAVTTRWQRLHHALTSGPGHSMRGWIFSAGSWCTKLLVIATVLAEVGKLPATAAWRGALGGELGALWPLQGPAGLGTYEASVWLATAWPWSGPPRAEVVAAALVAHATVWLTTVTAGSLAWWTWRPAPTTARSAASLQA